MNNFENMLKNDGRSSNKKEERKRILLIGIISCIVIIAISGIMILYYKRKDANTFKLFLNDQQIACSKDFFIYDNKGNAYVKAKELASYINWSYQNGEYGSFTENEDSGYVQNKYEIASFVSNSNKLKKYIQVTAKSTESEETVFVANSKNGTVENSTLELPIIFVNNQIYFPLNSLSDICDVSVNFPEEHRLYLYSQEYLINLASAKAAEWGYTSLSGVYENIRALSYGIMVVNRNDTYGVVNMYTGEQMLGFKYTNVVFAQNVKEFFVSAVDNFGEETVGIVSYNGDTIISPKSYENISILDDELGLYLVEKDNTYGVLNRKGDTVVYCDYDAIGLPESVLETFESNQYVSKYLIFDNIIAVEKNGKYGLYDLDGDKLLDTNYYGFGYDVSKDDSAVTNSKSVITISSDDIQENEDEETDKKVEFKIIIIQQKALDSDEIKYGFYDVNSKNLIVPCNLDRVYSKTSGGKTTYYLEFQGNTYELMSLMKSI